MNTEDLEFDDSEFDEEMEHIQNVIFSAKEELELAKELIEGLDNEKEKEYMAFLLKIVNNALEALDLDNY